MPVERITQAILVLRGQRVLLDMPASLLGRAIEEGELLEICHEEEPHPGGSA